MGWYQQELLEVNINYYISQAQIFEVGKYENG